MKKVWLGLVTLCALALMLVGLGGASAANGPDILFPLNPVVGEFPERGCNDPSPSPACGQLGGFTRLDYEGWSTLNGVNERQSFVADPNGSSKTVMETQVYGDDTADQWGGTRATVIASQANSALPGESAWITLGVYFPVGFQYPDQWEIINDLFPFPSHTHGTWQIELRKPGGTNNCFGSSGNRSELCVQIRQDGGVNCSAPGPLCTYYDLGPINEGHWTYITYFARFGNGDGEYKAWRADDALPDTSQAPRFDANNIVNSYSDTAYIRPGIPLYRGPSTHDQHQVVYYCGYHKAADVATSQTLPNCPTGEAPPPPPPPPPPSCTPDPGYADCSAEITALKGQVSDLQGQVSDLQDQNAALQAQVNDFQQRINAAIAALQGN